MKKNPACNPDTLGYHIDSIENGNRNGETKKDVEEQQENSFLRKGTF